MKRITKDVCVNETNNEWRPKFRWAIAIVILGAFSVDVEANGIWWLIAYIIFFGIFTLILYYLLRKKFNHATNDNSYYIVEDVFINVQEKNTFTNRSIAFNYGGLIGYRHLRKYDFEIKFSRNGMYQIILFSKNEPKEIDADYSAVFFSELGDKFYLLMSKNPKSLSENSKKDMIIKAFNAKYYKLVEEDFEYKDGKYYPKKINTFNDLGY